MRHVYLHVPFCRRRCSYCDFSIAVRRAIPAGQYLEAIRREHGLLRAAGDWDEEPLQTLYLGGGTPSLLPPGAVADLVGYFHPAPSAGVEVTIEANPDDVTPVSAAAWRRAGINRVSLGVQSFDPAVLRWMHRTHGPEQAGAAVSILREAGFDNLSLDLIFALPDAVRPAFQHDLEQALALQPDHLSVYGLSVEARTPLARWTSRGALALAGEERYAREFLLAHERLAQAGFGHYEVSNYARPGRRARHNSAYWTGAPYAGLGPSAHGYAAGIRRWNVAPWAAYQRAVSRSESPEEGREMLTADQRRLEAFYLGLRTGEGIALASIPASARGVLEDGARHGLLEVQGQTVRATPRGWLTLDGLVARLTT